MFIHDELWVCQDCLLVIANGDDSGLDNHPETAEARRAAIAAGLERLGPHVVADSDKETDIEFSSRPCGCCQGHLAGSRHHCSILCEHPECEPPLDEFEQAFFDCALWSSQQYDDEGDNGTPLDDDYTSDDFDPKSRAKLRRDCRSFREQAKELIEQARVSDEQAGHDFWLTRNGHGAGFWDRGLGEVGDKLSELCKPYGSVDLYVHDGKVYAQ